MYRDQYTTAPDSQNEEHVPAHLQKPQHQRCIQPNLFDKYILFSLHNGREPGEEALAHNRRSMFSVGMLELWSINHRVMRSDYGK